MHRWLVRLAAVAAAGAAAACGSAGGNPPTPTATPQPPPPIAVRIGEPVVIGVSAALSGDQINLGADISDAAELAVADFGALKGHPVTIDRRDDGCTDAEKAVAVARALIDETNIAGVIGPMCTTGAQAANNLYEKAQIVHISASATRVELSEQGEAYFFRTAWRDDVQAKTQAAYARNQLAAAAAVVIDDGEPYGKALADAFAAEFEAAGGRVLSRQRISRGTVDFTSLSRGILGADPDLVVFEGLNPEGALIVKKLREDGYTRGFMAPDGVFSVRDYLIPAGAATEGSILSGGPTPDEGFVARFSARFGRAPGTPFVLQAYDAVTTLLRAIDAVAEDQGGGALRIDRERLRDAVRASGHAGLTGTLSFDERGDRIGHTAKELGLTLYRVEAGRFVAVE